MKAKGTMKRYVTGSEHVQFPREFHLEQHTSGHEHRSMMITILHLFMRRISQFSVAYRDG